MRSRLLVWLVVAVAVAGSGWYVWRAAYRARDARLVELPRLADASPISGSFVVFTRQTGAPGARSGVIGAAPLDDLAAVRYEDRLRCARIDAASGVAICLEERGTFPVKYVAAVLDRRYERTAELALEGLPSRVQLSPSGRYAGITVFVAGHSYLEAGFSTRTSILDVASGRWAVEDLEAFSVLRDGRPFREVDFNFWGVTFAADNRTFFATLGSGGQTYLVRGTVDGGTAEVIESDVECPSLSPDNRRVAFKHRRVGRLGDVTWNLQVLDLESRARVTLAETASVDDQVQWLDDNNILYALRGSQAGVIDTWVVPADGSGPPRVYLPMSYSTSVVRQ